VCYRVKVLLGNTLILRVAGWAQMYFILCSA